MLLDDDLDDDDDLDCLLLYFSSQPFGILFSSHCVVLWHVLVLTPFSSLV